ncbi:uncharacterized protein LOC131443318 [Solea solea]|uniref:uncharacterized protein LOC131443318 n=1 Tax=Solea solea TaxID=90069 RepID=UPI00272BBEDE|nr:uncharacterized protein LOC131443318 [Solea solea]
MSPFMASLGYQPPLFNFQEEEIAAATQCGDKSGLPFNAPPNSPRDRPTGTGPPPPPISQAKKCGSPPKIFPFRSYPGNWLPASLVATPPASPRAPDSPRHLGRWNLSLSRFSIVSLLLPELEQVARFMGHDIRVHCDYYRQTDKTFQVAKIRKLLFAMEQGGQALTGKSLMTLDSVVFDGTSTNAPKRHGDQESGGDDDDDVDMKICHAHPPQTHLLTAAKESKLITDVMAVMILTLWTKMEMTRQNPRGSRSLQMTMMMMMMGVVLMLKNVMKMKTEKSNTSHQQYQLSSNVRNMMMMMK